jgi:hypothetical protein
VDRGEPDPDVTRTEAGWVIHDRRDGTLFASPMDSGGAEDVASVSRTVQAARVGWHIAGSTRSDRSTQLPTARAPGRLVAPGRRPLGKPRHDADASKVLDAVRQAEDSDPDRARWPRSKGHDDATLVIAALAP